MKFNPVRGVLASRVVLLLFVANSASLSAADNSLRIEVTQAHQGSAEYNWLQVRSAYVPGSPPLWMTTLSQYNRATPTAHAFHDVYASFKRGREGDWTQPVALPTLARVKSAAGDENVPADLWPLFHPPSGKILITGKIFHFDGGDKENILKERIGYAVYNLDSDTCGPLRVLEFPARTQSGQPVIAANAGCNQPFLLPDGDVLLPVRFQTSEKVRQYTSVVARCRFDGELLTYLTHGSEHTVPSGRGLYEPSVIGHAGRFWLTMRTDGDAYLAVGENGVDYEPHQPWLFDDGRPLDCENTQQHWFTLGERLYLVYTRRGAMNDHVMRHRAPLFVAEVDCQSRRLVRSTEQIALPENGVSLGNSGVVQVGPDEVWITCGEDATPRNQPVNRVWVARITAGRK